MAAQEFGRPGASAGQRPALGVVVAQALRAAPDGVGAREVAADGDSQPGAGPAAGLLGQLQRHAVKDDDVILPDDPRLFVTEDLVEIDVAHGDEGTGGIRGRPGELNRSRT